MRKQYVSLVSAAIMCSAAACASYETKNVINNPRPDPERRAQTERQRMEGELVASARVSGNVVRVVVKKPVLCRELTTTPMVADVADEKTLTSEGRGVQYLLGGGAVVLAALGGYYLASPCTKSESRAGGEELEVRCTSDEASKQKSTGVGLLVLGGAAGGMFAVNVARTQDESAVRSVEPVRSESPWDECDSERTEGVQVHLAYGDEAWSALTDENGLALFDMTDHEPPEGLRRDPVADVVIGGRELIKVDLSKLTMFASWKQRAERLRAERDALLQEEQVRAAQEAEEVAAAWQETWKRVEDSPDSYYQRAANLIRARLTAPATARMAENSVALVCPDGSAITTHGVDAQNSFGAYVRNHFSVAHSASGVGLVTNSPLVKAAALAEVNVHDVVKLCYDLRGASTKALWCWNSCSKPCEGDRATCTAAETACYDRCSAEHPGPAGISHIRINNAISHLMLMYRSRGGN